jgi:Ser/Thr protein kinase RdoA (MazF antagonist)
MTNLSVIEAANLLVAHPQKKILLPCHQRSTGLFSSEIRDHCFSRFGVTAAHMVSERHPFIFDAITSTGTCILKVTHPSHRSYEQLEAELEWLSYLVGKGVRAPRIHRSINSLFIERVPAADDYFSVICYEKIVGDTIADALLTEALFRPWGTLIGKLHRLSFGYLPKTQRYAWYESDFLNVERYLPIDHDIRTNAQRIIREVQDLPLSQFQYGLIHADVYQENMFLADGELFLFDFDNCEYGHYISDIAVALYAALWRVPSEADRAEFSERFLRSLLVGYREEHQLSRTEIEALPLFLQLREVLIYTVAKKMLDLKNLTPIQARLLTERGNRIRKNEPIVDLKTALSSV